MDIIVCVKHVPETAEAEVKIDTSSKSIDKAGLVFDINEWDEYALEEAVLLKEKFGGSVTAITVGSDDSESTLRKCLAKGVDNAVRLTDPKFEGSDSYATARILHSVIKDLPFDLILTGLQADDDGYAAVGPVLAGLLSIPHVTMVKKAELSGGVAKVNRELEGGLEEVLEVKLPALFTIQTGINEPRYVSIMGIRKASKKEIKVLNLTSTGLEEADVGEAGSWMKIRRLFVPPAEKQAEFIKGGPDEIATRIVEILKKRGLL